MIEIVKNIWVGDSKDEAHIARVKPPVNAVLVTAHDMVPTNDWRNNLEYMHIGLVDGPGNALATYHAAVLGLVALCRRGEDRKIIVCDHDGGRSLAIVIMYLYLMGECPSWDECIERLKVKGVNPPAINEVHRKAFFLMDWGMMTRVLGAEVSDEPKEKVEN